jgi:monofunctional glycosyltransferase
MVKRLYIGMSLLAMFFAGVLLYAILSVPDVHPLLKHNPPETALMQQRHREDEEKGKRTRRFQVWVPYESISGWLKTAVLIGEDDAFFQHHGVDYEQVKQSFIKNWEDKSFVRGGSTITQQLAKNLYLSTSKNPLRKLREFFIARRLEKELGKPRIFEIYLNVIEWGDGIYGAQAASLTYFHKSARELTLQQAVQMAAMIPNPRVMSPFWPTRRFLHRTNVILERMHQYHHISDAQYQQALEKEPEGASQENDSNPALDERITPGAVPATSPPEEQSVESPDSKGGPTP